MEIIKLPIGEQAAVDVDCIRIEEQAEAVFKLSGSALCTAVDAGDSVTLIGGPDYDSAEQAEAAGIAWAATVGVERLFVSMGTVDHPFEILEIDKPL